MSTSSKPESVVANASSESFLKQLKTRTQAEHLALEATEFSQMVMSPALTLDRYLTVLYGFYGAFQPIEKEIKHALQEYSVNLNHPNRSTFAVEDIRFLSGQFDESRLLHSDHHSNEIMHSLPVALGMLYVLEGSKLGGRIISRHLSTTLGIIPNEGGRFFGTGEIEDWRNFQQYCTQYVQQHPEHRAIIIESAKSTFRRIERYFQLANPNTSC